MSVSIDLRVLARKLEKSSDELLVNASVKGEELLDKVSSAIVAASTLLEEVADDIDANSSFDVSVEQLDELAALASALDVSTDPLLKKQASVLDEILCSIGSSKLVSAQTKKANEDELNRLRAERRKEVTEKLYTDSEKEHLKMRNADQIAKAVEQQIKRYVPMESSLQTRYPPDRPGGQMTRITDHVYQDPETGIIYDFKNGYKTQKGNEVPGGGVENQTRQLGDFNNSHSALFSTRESIMGRFASDNKEDAIKIIKAVAKIEPAFLDGAIDLANENGVSTAEVGEALSDVGNAWQGYSKNEKLTEIKKLYELLIEFQDCGSLGKKMSADIVTNAFYNGVLTKEELVKLVEDFGLVPSERKFVKKDEAIPATEDMSKQTVKEMVAPTEFATTASFLELKKTLAGVRELSEEDFEDPKKKNIEELEFEFLDGMDGEEPTVEFIDEPGVAQGPTVEFVDEVPESSWEDEDDESETPSSDDFLPKESLGLSELKAEFEPYKDIISDPDLTTPKEDLSGWLDAYNKTIDELDNDKNLNAYLRFLNNAGEYKNLYTKNHVNENKDLYSKVKKGYFVKAINDKGFVSPFDYDYDSATKTGSGKMWVEVANELLYPESEEEPEVRTEIPSNWTDYYYKSGVAADVEEAEFAQNTIAIDAEIKKRMDAAVQTTEKQYHAYKWKKMPLGIEKLSPELKEYLFAKMKDKKVDDHDVVTYFLGFVKDHIPANLSPEDKKIYFEHVLTGVTPSVVNEGRRALPYLKINLQADILKKNMLTSWAHKIINETLGKYGYPPKYTDTKNDITSTDFMKGLGAIAKK